MPEDPDLISTNDRTDIHNEMDRLDPVDDYLNQLANTITQIDRREISKVIDVLYDAWKHRKQVFILGNGGSAATASHMVNDLCKLTAVDGKKRFKAFALTDNVPLMTAWSNDSCFEKVFAEQLVNYIEPGDVVIAISTSGESQNVICALELARERKARCIGFTGNNGGRMKDLVDFSIFIPDEHIGRQEDGHLVLDHVISNTLRWMIAGEIE
jgi:D-sedoheptulose 7-phosphate isomerase